MRSLDHRLDRNTNPYQRDLDAYERRGTRATLPEHLAFARQHWRGVAVGSLGFAALLLCAGAAGYGVGHVLAQVFH